MEAVMLNAIAILAALLIVGIGYALILRPILHRVPQFQKFYAEADGFWPVVWAYCGKSVTVLWSYILGGVGLAFSLLDKAGPLLGDPDLNLQQRAVDLLKDNPQVAGYVVLALSMVTLITRLRSLVS
jgi:hypothetical protein